MDAPPKEYLIRETVRDGDPALAVDTEEKFDRALDSGMCVVPPSRADAMAWYSWDEDNTDSFEDVFVASDPGRKAQPGT